MSIILAAQGILVKMLIALESHHIFDQILHTNAFFKLAGKMTKKINKF